MISPSTTPGSRRRDRASRRRALQALATAAGGVLFVAASHGPRLPLVLAQESDDDNSGRGRGGGRGDHDDHHDEDGEEGPEGAASAAEIPAGSIEVRIVGDDAGDFIPAELTVDAGQSVTFVNLHSDEHTATGSGFDTGIIADEGGMATVVLERPGVFPYACQIHPEMTGVIRVRDQNGTVPESQSAAQPVPAGAATLTIANLAFDPATISVATGMTVAWTNEDSVPHTVTASDGTFDSGIVDPGGSFAFTFNEPGAFAYACQLHPQMQGTVVVEGEPIAAATPTNAQPDATSAEDTEQAAALASGEASVSIVDFAFEPATLDIPVGTTVVWTNAGQTPHSVSRQ